MQALQDDAGELKQCLSETEAKSQHLDRFGFDEKTFRWSMNEDAMATEKLAEGIRRFHEDALKLEQMLKKMLS